jgi:8-oxo-dGTP pyrophosphatase MutT (NUDIX family)
MRIEIFGDGIDRSQINKTQHKITARCVVVNEGKVLAVHFLSTDHYNLPGGGIEKHETLEIGLKREVLEETGYQVIVLSESIIIMEYYPESTWETHFFKCELTDSNQCSVTLTEEEISSGLTPVWIELYAFLEILETAPTRHPYGQNIHQRELIGLLNSL